MDFDPRAKQIIEMFSNTKVYSPLMAYDETYTLDVKTVAKKFYDRIKHLDHKVQKKKYHDELLNKNLEAWYITINLKHSIIDAFFFQTGEKTRVIILRKDKPYITFAIGAAAIASIIVLGRMLTSLTLNSLLLLKNFIIVSLLLGGTIYATEKLALPEEMRKIIRGFDEELLPYRAEATDAAELENKSQSPQPLHELPRQTPPSQKRLENVPRAHKNHAPADDTRQQRTEPPTDKSHE